MTRFFLFFITCTLFSCGKNTTKVTKENDSLVTYTFNKIKVSNSKVELQKSLKKSHNDIVFLGDSKIEGFPLQEMFENPNLKNRGIAGNTTSDVISRLNFITSGKPQEIFLEIGVNDLNQNISVTKTFENFQTICNRIKTESPETKIFIQSVLPTTFESKNLNPKIQEYNNLLRDFCVKQNITYIDVNSPFLSGTEMNKKYTIDGIHLNAEGYKLWKDILNDYIKQSPPL